MKSKRIPQVSQTTFHTTFNAPVGTAYINSTSTSDIIVEITQAELRQIDAISVGYSELERAAQEIHAESPQSASRFEKVQKWVMILMTIEGLTEKAAQHGPKIAAIIHHFSKS